MNEYSFLNLGYYGGDAISKSELFDSELDQDKSYKTKGNFDRHLRKHGWNFTDYCHKYYPDLVPVCLETGELSDNTIKGYYFGWYRIKEEFGDLKRKVNCQVSRLRSLADEGYENDYLKHLYWIKEKGYSLSEAYSKINSFFTSEKYKYLFDSYYDESWTSEGIVERKKSILTGDFEKLSPKFTLKGWVQRGWDEKEAVKKKDEHIAKNNLQHKWGPDSEEVVSPLKIEYWIDRGFSESKAEQKVSNLQMKRVKKRYEKYDEEERRKHIPSCVEYWLDRGCSKDEAKEKISEIQSRTSLESFVNRYGEDQGKKKFREMNKKWKESLKSSGFYLSTLSELIDRYGDFEGRKKYAKTYWNKEIDSIEEFKSFELMIKDGYTVKFHDSDFRSRILKEQNGICGNPECTKSEDEVLFHLHHIDYDKSNDNRENLIFLCCNCHAKTCSHHNKNKWISFYQKVNKKFYE